MITLFGKKKTKGLPLGIIIGAMVGIAGISALVASNREMRKTVEKEWSKYCKKGGSTFGMDCFCK